ncbi:acid phosphatase [Corynebacterium aquilae DSM 44791]|uniref:Acid phosphatase n=1 Tax=Corynebacterium aquilae DSM 44791 TaxID=1431546 RepID=A0A1L7CDX5_9CORY|nr:acid phosphatase [Corynebacterium aquilae DSM 44791]
MGALFIATATASASLSGATGIAQADSLPKLPAVAPGQHEPVYHEGAPVPVRFGPDAYVGYISDISSHDFGIYNDVISSFGALRSNDAVMQQNLDTVVAINNAAANNPAVIARAQADAKADQDGLLDAFADAFGQDLAPHVHAALAEHRLPKTEMLLGGGWFARAGGLASSMFIEKEIYKNDRPFFVAPERIKRYEIDGRQLYLNSKSFPSGHTNQATWTTTLLAAMLPELAPQFLARGSEAGYNRVVMGVHYPLDVIGGRMTGTAAAADRWNDPKMRANLQAAAEEIRAELEWRCGDTLANCVAKQNAAGKAYSKDSVGEYTTRATYGFAPIGATDAPMIVPQAAPDLLLGAFPHLSYEQRRQILAQTALPAGLPLDDQGPKGSWQRLNLAKAMTANITIGMDGNVTVH